MKILGCIISGDGQCGDDVENRVQAATRAFYANQEQLCYQGVGMQKRLQLLYSLVGQILLYGTQTCALTDSYLDRLDGCYMKFIANMLRIRRDSAESVGEYLHRRRSEAKR
eukprot:2823706-Karenia_brevis.AAC.1